MAPIRLKDIAGKTEKFARGHRLCPGCGAAITVRQVMLAVGDRPVVVATATGCMEIGTSLFPHTSWRVPWIHTNFPNAASTISGVEAMYRAKRKKGEVSKKIKFIAFGGDGGTYDIGFQALSGAAERGHDFVYICLNNEGYMNTGGQRSSATPMGADTTTSPSGKVLPGKIQWRKDMVRVMAEHGIYAAQACPSKWMDLMRKVEKALEIDGPAYIDVLIPCPTGWKDDPSQSLVTVQKAVDSCYWPLYEIEGYKIKLNYKPKEKIPITEWFRSQGRFQHLLKPEYKDLVAKIQAEVDRRWERLLKDAGEA